MIVFCVAVRIVVTLPCWLNAAWPAATLLTCMPPAAHAAGTLAATATITAPCSVRRAQLPIRLTLAVARFIDITQLLKSRPQNQQPLSQLQQTSVLRLLSSSLIQHGRGDMHPLGACFHFVFNFRQRVAPIHSQIEVLLVLQL